MLTKVKEVHGTQKRIVWSFSSWDPSPSDFLGLLELSLPLWVQPDRPIGCD